MNSDYRYDHKSVVIEGIKMVNEIAANHSIKTLVVRDESLIPLGCNPENVMIVDDSVIKKISGMHSSEGVIAEIAMPPFSKLQNARFVIALDHINDPGNLGTILRTSLAFGWEGVFLIGEGCDPYNEKALRSARGATFRIPLRQGNWADFDEMVSALNAQPLVADIIGEPIVEGHNPSTCILVLGNEAHGPSKDALTRCKKVTLPMSGSMESLNVSVAGGILMYLLRH